MNKLFADRAQALKPVLNKEKVSAVCPEKTLSEGDSVVLDFGNHYVGYFTAEFTSTGSHQDAPAFLKLKFCEREEEITEPTDDYHGWISRSWIQEEYVHIDVLPHTLQLPRRYAFRYVKIEVLGLSSKYQLKLLSANLTAVTSAPEEVPLAGNTEKERLIDKAALRTLRECMQYEFEDGPKRDRRLWLGDLRLQALANYETYKHNDLVKRCLYLFAATAEEGNISACVFTEPQLSADDTFMFDYSLLFVPTLLDYYRATGDKETAKELFPLALKQFDIAEKQFDGDIVKDSDVLGWCFLDWNLALNKQSGAQAVYLYSLKSAVALLKELGEEWAEYEALYDRRAKAAISVFYDTERGLFTSGEMRQISYAANVWFCLARVFSQEENHKLLAQLKSAEDAVKPVTPYMMHHYIQALIDCGEITQARKIMTKYWGGMIDMNADTFFELFNPDNPNESPYGSKVVNSYCHAWSCTPAYFLRKYFK